MAIQNNFTKETELKPDSFLLAAIDAKDTKDMVDQQVSIVSIDSHNSKSGEHTNKDPYTQLNLGMFILTWVVFLILLFILKKFAWKPILKSLDERENFIKKSLEDAEKAKKEMEDIAVKQKEMLSEAQGQANEIVAKGKEVAVKIAIDIEEKAKEEGKKIVSNARAEIESETKKAIQTLKAVSVDLAITAAGKLIDKNLDDEKNRKLVDDSINSLN